MATITINDLLPVEEKEKAEKQGCILTHKKNNGGNKSKRKNEYEVSGLNYYGYHFGDTFEHEYYARQYIERAKAKPSTIALTLRINGKVVESYESRGSKLVKVSARKYGVREEFSAKEKQLAKSWIYENLNKQDFIDENDKSCTIDNSIDFYAYEIAKFHTYLAPKTPFMKWFRKNYKINTFFQDHERIANRYWD